MTIIMHFFIHKRARIRCNDPHLLQRIKMKTGFLLVCLIPLTLMPAMAAAPRWNLNDVSFLFPLSETLLSPKSAGSKGVLLPRDLFNRIPALTDTGAGKDQLYNTELKVVSVRIDPCPNTFKESECSPEVRLIWQPVTKNEETKNFNGDDATLHTFYSLSRNEFTELKKDLWQWKMENEKLGINTHFLPLGIHPALKNEKQNQQLMNLLLKNAGEKNLVKITFMSLLTRNIWWRFGGLVKTGSLWAKTKIPRLSSPFQDIFNSALEETTAENDPGVMMDTAITLDLETYPEADNLLYLTSEGFRYNDARDQQVFFEKLSVIDRFRNPMKTNPNTLDCASCHYADNARFFAEKTFPELKSVVTKEAFVNPEPAVHNLSNTSIGLSGTRLVRAFGYFQDVPSLSQRTINDSAVSADWMNKHP